MKRILIFTPHADDLTIFCGGLVALLTRQGNEVCAVRITDDRTDSYGLGEVETIQRNCEEAEEAYRILGIKEVVHLNYPSDTLGDISEVELREKMVRLIRQICPHKVIGFDLEGRFEENMDHVKCAQALAEACWTSSFDRHDTHHFAEGLAPHAVGERIFFARNPVDVNIHFDISAVIEQKIEAIAAQKTVMKNFFHQMKLRGEANGVSLPLFDSEMNTGIVVDFFVRQYFSSVGEPYGCDYAEAFRRERAGLLDAFIPSEVQEEG